MEAKSGQSYVAANYQQILIERQVHSLQPLQNLLCGSMRSVSRSGSKIEKVGTLFALKIALTNEKKVNQTKKEPNIII